MQREGRETFRHAPSPDDLKGTKLATPQLGDTQDVAPRVVAWQLLVASGWRPDYLLPGPAAVAERLGAGL